MEVMDADSVTAGARDSSCVERHDDTPGKARLLLTNADSPWVTRESLCRWDSCAGGHADEPDFEIIK